ncbi:probable gluconokinase isoform X2 [Hemicordylus capensis]|nr:probable gluconokinase isoform X2 [Hemicordylus capensis]XP_053151692.1 probable gluconokinase isoform X2 [Hemicordylus capensis]XP_053151693.1 probable gluconokinase isoform X2 [Hemicordylus capensis]XP_053151694.1 probable gluconokinase isoform X2 [Hemicordylus capensis]XP_053151695.1 probable gluconokinase isoform X2 [Hemicordylus capensis]
MAEGKPLNDQDRIPWLCHLHDILMREHASGQNAIVACSALKKRYRWILENGETGIKSASGQSLEQEVPTPPKILFVHLAGPMDLIARRLGKRKGHFMPPDLLQSQFDTLEPPSAPENFLSISLEKPVSEIISEIEEYVRSIC